MPPCEVRADGWCDRHQRIHRHETLRLALEVSDHAEQCRLMWDQHPLNGQPPVVPSNLPPIPKEGVGTELEKLLELIGIVKWKGCDCERMKRQMNALGPMGCRVHRSELVAWLKVKREKLGWFTSAQVGVTALSKGIVLNPLDPCGSILDLAIARAELKGGST